MLRAYAVGVFPMADHRSAAERLLGRAQAARRAAAGRLPFFPLAQEAHQAGPFPVTVDAAVRRRIIRLCAESAADRPDTWINGPIERVFLELHRRGFAHSLECWDGEHARRRTIWPRRWAGHFSGSRWSRGSPMPRRSRSRISSRGSGPAGSCLLDCQFITEHLTTLGAVEIPRDDYVALLAARAGRVGGRALGGHTFG